MRNAARGTRIIGTVWKSRSGNVIRATEAGRDIFGTPSIRVERIGVERAAEGHSDVLEPEDFGVWNVSNLRRSCERVRVPAPILPSLVSAPETKLNGGAL